MVQPLIEEKRELQAHLKKIETSLETGAASESEKELFEQLQAEMGSCSTQIGRKTEQLRMAEEDILRLEKKV